MISRSGLTALIAGSLIGSATAMAQTAPTSPAMPSSSSRSAAAAAAQPQANSVNAGPFTSADRQFLAQDARGGAYELQISQLASQKSQNDKVKQYAQQVVSDHSEADQALQQLAQQANVNLPTQPSSTQQKRARELAAMNGAAFDRAYARDMRVANESDARQSKTEEASTRNPGIKGFIDRFRQIDETHAQGARDLEASLGAHG